MEENPGALVALRDDPASRKRFLKMVGGSGAAGALAMLVAACGGGGVEGGDENAGDGRQTRPRAQRIDLDILSFALTLEHVESAYYRRVVEEKVVKDGPGRSLLEQTDENERRHVATLTGAIRKLGGTPPKAPETDFDAILDGGPGKVLDTAATLENVGAAAYVGQAAKIQSEEILSTALGIHTVEARQAAAFNDLVGRGFTGKGRFTGSVPNGAFARPITAEQAMARIKPFLADG